MKRAEQLTNSGPPRKKQRTNVVKRACLLCRAKHQKCDGAFPCARCIKKRLQCSYPEPKKRGPVLGKRKELTQELTKVKQELELQKQEVNRWKLMYERSTTSQATLWSLSSHLCIGSQLSAYIDLYRKHLEGWQGVEMAHWDHQSAREVFQSSTSWTTEPQVLILLGSMSISASIWGAYHHADHMLSMSRRILQNVYDVANPTVAAGLVLVGTCKFGAGDFAGGAYYTTMASQMISILLARGQYKKGGKTETTLWRLHRSCLLYMADIAPTSEKAIEQYEEVSNALSHLLKSPHLGCHTDCVQLLWALGGAIWLKTCRPVFMASRWDLENLKVNHLMATDYANALTQLAELDNFADRACEKQLPVVLSGAKLFISTVRMITHFAGNNLKIALQIAKNTWEAFKEDWLMQKYYPNALSNTYYYSYVALYAGDAVFFEEVLLFYIAFAKTWPLANVIIKALLKQAKTVSLPYNAQKIDPMVNDLAEPPWPITQVKDFTTKVVDIYQDVYVNTNQAPFEIRRLDTNTNKPIHLDLRLDVPLDHLSPTPSNTDSNTQDSSVDAFNVFETADLDLSSLNDEFLFT